MRNFQIDPPRIPKKWIAAAVAALFVQLAVVVGLLCLIAYLVKWVIS